MATKDKERLDSAIFQYVSTSPDYEEENKLLRKTLEQLQEELNRFKSPALMVCEIKEAKGKNAIIKIPNGNEFFVHVSNDCEHLRPGDYALVEQKNLTIIKKINFTGKFNVEKFVIIEQPTVRWEDIGGLDDQINEIKEVVELPLQKPQLFKKVGIQPPKGILLYGVPGTGKTLLAKAVAASTKSTFIEVVGSELVQKFIGEGAKLVNEIFQLAKKNAPSIVFIDEIDALASIRMETGTSGEREVNRTFMQLLAEIDGFDPLGDVKVIGATNRKDILDPAVLRPGRLDRLIRVPVPNDEGRIAIFKIHTRKMKLDKTVDIDELKRRMDGFSGAEIKAVCTEAGYCAIRKNKVSVSQKYFLASIKKVKKEEESEGKDYMMMFG